MIKHIKSRRTIFCAVLLELRKSQFHYQTEIMITQSMMAFGSNASYNYFLHCISSHETVWKSKSVGGMLAWREIRYKVGTGRISWQPAYHTEIIIQASCHMWKVETWFILLLLHFHIVHKWQIFKKAQIESL